MNTKKKHKNKKPTPNQPPKVETEIKEKVEDVIPKSDVKEDIPIAAAVVPAADVAEEVIQQVLESVEIESETPKKPKRKGKKKNQDKEIIEEESKEKIQETVQDDITKTDKQETNEGDDNKEQGENKSTGAYVTPNARKKKNKKKLQEETVQQPHIPHEKECLSMALEEKEAETQHIDTELKESQPIKTEETKPETKSKKKNKKKKRNDSEKSDKSEEVTCTSAFKQLLVEDDKPLEETRITTEETLQTKDDNIPITVAKSIIQEEIPKNWDVESTEEPLMIKNQDITEVPKEEIKNKKKNKKDKKHPHEEHIIEKPVEQVTITEAKPVMELIEPYKPQVAREPSLKPSPEVTSEVKPEVQMLEPLKPQVEREPSPKPKAKLAKPVEKKRKGQLEPATESLTKSTENIFTLKEETKNQERPHTPLQHVEEIKLVEEEFKKINPPLESQNIPQIVDTMNVPETRTKDKKKKKEKSPKPPNIDEKVEIKEEIHHIVSIAPPSVSEEELDITKSVEASSGMENVMFTMSDEAFIPLQKSEKIDEVPPLMKIEEANITDSKTGKKKKKTPKFPVASEMAETKEIKQLITPEITESKESPEIVQPPKTKKHSESVSTPLSELEIQSVKTDDSGSSCDATPDVHFIRSASHQHLDDNNNNTVIHEVSNVEESKPHESLTIPLIEGSGETPSATPDLVLSGIRMTESKTTGKEEPTYLKSKMMEVNQDMEELRLSIERSLAEFSAIEKSEEKAEKDYESHRIECEKTFAEVEVTKTEAKVSPEVQVNLPAEFEKKAEELNIAEAPPVCPSRKDNKGKSKSKKKGKQESFASTISTTQSASTTSESKDTKDKQEKTEQKTESTENKGKQQSGTTEKKGKQQSHNTEQDSNAGESKIQTEEAEDSNKLSSAEQTFSDSLEQLDFAPIDNFEDALTSSIDDVNKTFEMIVNDNTEQSQKQLAANKPEINITAPSEDTETNKTDTQKRDDKVNPVSQPKNFLGQNNIPAQSNRTDYKKEKNKTPNEMQAKVKIKDSKEVEAKKQSKESQTAIKRTKKQLDKSEKESFSRVKNDNEEYVYKYSFRKVFLQSACHICHKELVQRVPCGFCNLVFYCGAKHKDEDWPQHQALCFAVSTIVHLKDQKHIYAEAQNITGQDYRLLRMQMIVSCEKVLKRRLVPWEQEAMLYPRMCGDAGCREWRQAKLKDCEGCGQISYCADNPAHLPRTHQRWCKSYHLYSSLVGYQQTRGRLEPPLPTKVMDSCLILEKMNEVLASMYEEKIDVNDIQYAALTQLATAPLTAAYCYQLCKTKMNYTNGIQKKSSFIIHVVGAELQFEADALNKWEVFFLHLRPDVTELRVVLISPVLNPGDLPLDLLGNIRLCDSCRQKKRRVVFSFQDKKNYFEYRSSEEFVSPDLVCSFNPSIQRSSVYNGKDPWPNTINCIIKQKIPFIITGYTLTELRKDIARIKECSENDFRVISEPVFNNFASVRPDRNFISDDEMPLLFKNYCVSVLCGC